MDAPKLGCHVQQECVDQHAGGACNGELDGPRPVRAEAQGHEMRQVAEAFLQVGLAGSGKALAKGEPDFRDLEARGADQDLEQDLEAARLQGGEIDGVPADQEEPAHGIGDALQAAREQNPGRQGRKRRNGPASDAEVADAAFLGVPRRNDELGAGGSCPAEKERQHLRWVLQVSIHDGHPGRPGRRETGEHRSAQPIRTLAGATMDHADDRSRVFAG